MQTHTLYVAAAILSKDGLQSLVRLIVALVQPMFDFHSSNTRLVRDSDSTRQWYLDQSRGQLMHPLAKVCSLLKDVRCLEAIGLTMSLPRFQRETEENDRVLVADDALAKQAIDITLGLVRYRCSSMSWHSTWPGRLAEFGSTNVDTRADALHDLQNDWKAFQEAKHWSEHPPS